MSESVLQGEVGAFERRGIPRRGHQFVVALICAAATGVIAHQDWPGSIIAVICALPLGLLIWAQTKQSWSTDSFICATFAAIAWIGVLIEPGPLNLSLFWMGLAGVSLVGQGMKLVSISAALETILRNFCFAPFRLLGDAKSLRASRHKVQIGTGWFANLVLPALTILIFGSLLAVSNPLIADFVQLFSWNKPFEYLLSGSTPTALATFAVLWIAFRMSPLAAKLDAAMTWAQPVWHSKYFKLAPVIATLIILNAMFAVENVLDYFYIWSGVKLPPGMSMVEYVHRGSYSLIATALIAGALIIAMFQPGSATNESKLVRVLVYFFALQNVLLVASSAMRTVFYVEESGMTLWRISAFVWMGLVTAGLALIALRVMFNKSNLWLLNTNLAAVLLILLASGIIDYNAIVAETNVSRALAKLPTDTSKQTQLDLDIPYLLSMGPSALPAIDRLEQQIDGRQSLGMWLPQKSASRKFRNGIYVSFNAATVFKLHSDSLREFTQNSQADWRTWALRFRNNPGPMVLAHDANP